ncbi:hypothetical protein Efla_002618 [Eimeria flavescens]
MHRGFIFLLLLFSYPSSGRAFSHCSNSSISSSIISSLSSSSSSCSRSNSSPGLLQPPPLLLPTGSPTAHAAAAAATAAAAAVDEAAAAADAAVMQLAAAAGLTREEAAALSALQTARPFSLPPPPLQLQQQQQQREEEEEQEQQQMLWGFMSLEQLAFHYARHHAGYVRTLNSLTEKDSRFQGLSPEGTQTEKKESQTSRQTQASSVHALCAAEALQLLPVGSPAFNACGQHLNHTFFFSSLQPLVLHAETLKPTRPQTLNPKPLRRTAKLLTAAFGGLEGFTQLFKAAATGHFGSGWVWLALTADGRAEIAQTHDGFSLPYVRPDLKPLLVIDVWEHAYYLDHKNARAAFVDGFLKAIDWAAVERRLEDAEKQLATASGCDAQGC